MAASGLLGIALALVPKPHILLLDERQPACPGESHEALETSPHCHAISPCCCSNTIMDLVFRCAERIAVLTRGAVLAEGAPEAIAQDSQVHEVCPGEGITAHA